MVRDPESRTINGKVLTNFSIACDRQYKNSQGQRETDFFSCNAWDKKGTMIKEYGRKGRRILITGEINNREWITPEGSKRTSTDINIETIEFLDRQDNIQAPPPVVQQQQQAYRQQAPQLQMVSPELGNGFKKVLPISEPQEPPVDMKEYDPFEE